MKISQPNIKDILSEYILVNTVILSVGIAFAAIVLIKENESILKDKSFLNNLEVLVAMTIGLGLLFCLGVYVLSSLDYSVLGNPVPVWDTLFILFSVATGFTIFSIVQFVRVIDTIIKYFKSKAV
jgi:hypothetical protein